MTLRLASDRSSSSRKPSARKNPSLTPVPQVCSHVKNRYSGGKTEISSDCYFAKEENPHEPSNRPALCLPIEMPSRDRGFIPRRLGTSPSAGLYGRFLQPDRIGNMESAMVPGIQRRARFARHNGMVLRSRERRLWQQ